VSPEPEPAAPPARPRATVRVRKAAPANSSPTAVAPPPNERSGSRGGWAFPGPRAAVSFGEVNLRARRLIEWSAEETAYLQSHVVALFSRADVEGRTYFADEGLYDLLPRLRRDAWMLRAACGIGAMSEETDDLCRRAARAVQEYYRLWVRLRDGQVATPDADAPDSDPSGVPSLRRRST